MPQPEAGASRRLLYLLPVALFLGLVAVFGARVYESAEGRDPSIIPSAMIDQPAPQFDLPPLIDGKPGLATGDLTGKPVVVNFFASWCAPCRDEHATWTGLAASGDAVTLYGIDYKDAPEAGKRFLSELGDPFSRIGVDRPGRAAIDFGVYGVPETYIVDGAGRIRYRHVGPVSEDVLRDEILPRLAQLGAGK